MLNINVQFPLPTYGTSFHLTLPLRHYCWSSGGVRFTSSQLYSQSLQYNCESEYTWATAVLRQVIS